eukprot:1156318-Pelagomonas_calceolata.AAC.3
MHYGDGPKCASNIARTSCMPAPLTSGSDHEIYMAGGRERQATAKLADSVYSLLRGNEERKLRLLLMQPCISHALTNQASRWKAEGKNKAHTAGPSDDAKPLQLINSPIEESADSKPSTLRTHQWRDPLAVS